MSATEEIKFSPLMLGTVQFGLDYGIANGGGKPEYQTCLDIVACALEEGITCFDTAAAYGESEQVLGRALAELKATDRAMIVSKSLPVFVDKPLADNEPDLNTFIQWVKEGRAIMSSSSMRYAKEFMPYRISTQELGELRFVSITTPKSWESYGIHALEAVYPILGPGFVSVRNTGTAERNIVHLKHRSGADVVVVASADMYGAFGCLQLCGTAGSVQVRSNDSFYSFKAQLVAFIKYLRTGVCPFPFAETEELMRLVIAGIRSREAGGAEVQILTDC